jgi:hypothetical protein
MLRHRLAREITVVLSIKVLLLLALFWFCFRPDQRPTITADSVHLLFSPDQPATPQAEALP